MTLQRATQQAVHVGQDIQMVVSAINSRSSSVAGLGSRLAVFDCPLDHLLIYVPNVHPISKHGSKQSSGRVSAIVAITTGWFIALRQVILLDIVQRLLYLEVIILKYVGIHYRLGVVLHGHH